MNQSRPWKPGTGQKIEALYAWVAEDGQGGEGVCSAELGDGLVYPLVRADIDGIKSMRPYAELLRRTLGVPIRLVRYGRREDLEELQ